MSVLRSTGFVADLQNPQEDTLLLKGVYLEHQASHKYTQGDTWRSSHTHMQNTKVAFLLQIEIEGPILYSVARAKCKNKSTIFR